MVIFYSTYIYIHSHYNKGQREKEREKYFDNSTFFHFIISFKKIGYKID